MMLDPRETVSAISERTLQNVRRARTWGFWVASIRVDWKLWTRSWFWKPLYSDRVLDWWEREDIYQVRWITCYWLCFAWSLYWMVDADPHERMNHVT